MPPKEACYDANQYQFQGKSADDLFLPMHMNYRFFGVEPMEKSARHDAMKNLDVDNDFAPFEAPLNKHF